MTIADQVTVITLERRPDRFALFLENNPTLPTERFAGIDGQQLDRWDCVDSGLITPGNPYFLNQLGSAVSHITLWKRAAAENRALHIAEDDAIFRRDFIPMARAMLDSLGAWDLVQWAWNYDWPMEAELGPGLGSVVIRADEAALRAQWRAFVGSTKQPLMARLRSNTGLCAYSLSPRGAQRLLTRVLPFAGDPGVYPGEPDTQWANQTLDVELTRHYAAIDAFVALPGLAISLNDKSLSVI